MIAPRLILVLALPVILAWPFLTAIIVKFAISATASWIRVSWLTEPAKAARESRMLVRVRFALHTMIATLVKLILLTTAIGANPWVLEALCAKLALAL